MNDTKKFSHYHLLDEIEQDILIFQALFFIKSIEKEEMIQCVKRLGKKNPKIPEIVSKKCNSQESHLNLDNFELMSYYNYITHHLYKSNKNIDKYWSALLPIFEAKYSWMPSKYIFYKPIVMLGKALLEKNEQLIQSSIDSALSGLDSKEKAKACQAILNVIYSHNYPSFYLEYFSKLPGYIQDWSTVWALNRIIFKFDPIDLAILTIQCRNYVNCISYFYFLEGDFIALEKLFLNNATNPFLLSMMGGSKFLEGNFAQSCEYYEQALKFNKKSSLVEQNLVTSTLSYIFYPLAHLKYYQKKLSDKLTPASIHSFLEGLEIAYHYGDMKEFFDYKKDMHPFLLSFLEHWSSTKISNRKYLLKLRDSYKNYNFKWLTQEIETLLGEPTGEKLPGLSSFIKITEPWQKALLALDAVVSTTNGKEENENKSEIRLVWYLDILNNNSFSLQPKEQKRKINSWTAGRNVALKRLYQLDPQVKQYITPQDKKIINCIQKEVVQQYYAGENYYFDTNMVIKELIGHPLLFNSEAPNNKIELVLENLIITADSLKNGNFKIQLNEKINFDNPFIFKQINAFKYSILIITDIHQRIGKIITSQGIELPPIGKDMLLQSIANLSQLIEVHSNIEGSANFKEVTANSTPIFQLSPNDPGLNVTVFVRPFFQHGNYFVPGGGGKRIFCEIDKVQCQTVRNFEEEVSNVKNIIHNNHLLSNIDQNDYSFNIQDPQDCLEIIDYLQKLENVLVEWPKGESFKIISRKSFNNLKLGIEESKNNWFELSGQIEYDDSLFMDLAHLLDLVGQSNSRFIPIKDGVYMALSAQFKNQLKTLGNLSERGKNKTTTINPFLFSQVQELIDKSDLEDKSGNFAKYRKKIKEFDKFRPDVPASINAQLREYQLQGFQWLAKLSQWGMGACLADDMGLGKTLQAICIFAQRSAIGPTLVVAPPSICFNWKEEIYKFSTKLKVVTFDNKDRESILKNLRPHDVLITSYGIIHQEIDALEKIQWATVCLDEAQLIKNFQTMRSKAAMRLNGAFKMITTGTPVENHLGELWNLFNFINPGLLGDLKNFTQKYVNENKSFDKLKAIVRPFVLRRLKNQVLEELPAKTEIVIHVELSNEEKIFYDVLRKKALESVSNLGDNAHLQILAQITKLRLACCHPKLILKESTIESSKLNALISIISDLQENGHKALIFSQFVTHLTIIREYFDEKKIKYQYLDGKTPVPQRKALVDNFQSGEGDFFLISLKAGGFGLNLTAADYVIHMDPWWNPAVEDQASDRAHRIGQERPVTVYRLVTQHTIEDKIIKLHEKKRELANAILEGSNEGHKISAKELISLLEEV